MSASNEPISSSCEKAGSWAGNDTKHSIHRILCGEKVQPVQPKHRISDVIEEDPRQFHRSLFPATYKGHENLDEQDRTLDGPCSHRPRNHFLGESRLDHSTDSDDDDDDDFNDFIEKQRGIKQSGNSSWKQLNLHNDINSYIVSKDIHSEYTRKRKSVIQTQYEFQKDTIYKYNNYFNSKTSNSLIPIQQGVVNNNTFNHKEEGNFMSAYLKPKRKSAIVNEHSYSYDEKTKNDINEESKKKPFYCGTNCDLVKNVISQKTGYNSKWPKDLADPEQIWRKPQCNHIHKKDNDSIISTKEDTESREDSIQNFESNTNSNKLIRSSNANKCACVDNDIHCYNSSSSVNSSSVGKMLNGIRSSNSGRRNANSGDNITSHVTNRANTNIVNNFIMSSCVDSDNRITSCTSNVMNIDDVNNNSSSSNNNNNNINRFSISEDKSTQFRVKESDTDNLSLTKSGVTLTLLNSSLWRAFDRVGTEMIINRGGRRMFPYLSLSVQGLNPSAHYSASIQIVPASKRRCKFIKSKWVPVGLADTEPTQLPYFHMDSPSLGQHWNRTKISFSKIKLTNNKESSPQNILLHSMHKYSIVTTFTRVDFGVQSEATLAGSDLQALTFHFPETDFIAVTAYQNESVTQMKIHNNPFAKAFRDASFTEIRKRIALRKRKHTPDRVRPGPTRLDTGTRMLTNPYGDDFVYGLVTPITLTNVMDPSFTWPPFQTTGCLVPQGHSVTSLCLPWGTAPTPLPPAFSGGSLYQTGVVSTGDSGMEKTPIPINEALLSINASRTSSHYNLLQNNNNCFMSDGGPMRGLEHIDKKSEDNEDD